MRVGTEKKKKSGKKVSIFSIRRKNYEKRHGAKIVTTKAEQKIIVTPFIRNFISQNGIKNLQKKWKKKFSE